MNKEKMTKSSAPKEVYVRIVKLSPSGKDVELNISKLKEEYDSENNFKNGWNVLSGGSVGASIGAVACFVTTVVGIPLTSPEVIVMVGSSLLFGLIAGFVLY